MSRDRTGRQDGSECVCVCVLFVGDKIEIEIEREREGKKIKKARKQSGQRGASQHPAYLLQSHHASGHGGLCGGFNDLAHILVTHGAAFIVFRSDLSSKSLALQKTEKKRNERRINVGDLACDADIKHKFHAKNRKKSSLPLRT